MTRTASDPSNQGPRLGDSARRRHSSLDPAQSGVMDLQPEHLQQTRSQISALVAEIAHAAKHYQERDAFFALVLDRTREAMGAVAVALWEQDTDGRWLATAARHLPESLSGSIGIALSHQSASSDLTGCDTISSIEQRIDAAQSLVEATDFPPPDYASEDHAAILQMVAREHQPVLVPPNSVSVGPDRPPNPTAYCLVYAPVRHEGEEIRYWLQAVQNPAGGPATHRGYLRFVVQVSVHVGEFLKNERLRTLERQRELFEAANSVFQEINAHRAHFHATSLRTQKQITPIEESTLLARGVAKWLKADEVFFVSKAEPGKRVNFSSSANGLRIVPQSEAAEVLMQSLMRACKNAHLQKPKLFCEAVEPSEFADCHSMFAAESIGWIPIKYDQSSKQRLLRFVGMIALWHKCENEVEAEKCAANLEAIAPTTRLATEWLDDLNIRRALRAIEQRQHRIGRIRSWALSAPMRTLVLTLLLGAACCIPVPVQISADARLVPTVHEAIYSPVAGTVRTVLVQYGQRVRAGDALLRISSVQLETEYESLLAEETENVQRRQDIELQLLRSKELTTIQRSTLEGELQTLNAVHRTMQQRIDLLNKQMEDLQVRSQIDGIVGTWKVDTLLNNRPVQAGQMLMSVYDPEGAWEFEVALEEKHVGAYLTQASAGTETSLLIRLDSHPYQVIRLPIDFADQPLVLHSQSDDSSVVPLRVKAKSEELPQLTPGATAVAKLDVGRQPVVWAITRDFVLDLWARVRLWV